MSAITRRGALAATFSVLAASAFAGSPSDQARLRLILVNDVYAMNENEDGRGGMARLAAIVAGERAAAAREGRRALFVHAGDALSPSLMSGLDHGAHMVELLNMIAPDVFVPGNHEFDFGGANYRAQMARARFPILAANMREASGAAPAGHADDMMVEAGGFRIGVVGATYEGAARLSSPDGFVFTATGDAVATRAAALRGAGADLVVAVIHADKSAAHALYQSHVADVVLAGHTHELLVEYDGRGILAESGQDAEVVTIIDIDMTARSGESGRRVRWRPRVRLVESGDVAPDPAVLARVRAFESEMSRELDAELAVLAEPLDSRMRIVRSGEAAIGNFIADALRAATGADVALVNGGGIRGNRIYPVGHRLTRRDVLAELPFGNKTVRTDVTGAEIRAAIENGLTKLEDGSGRCPHVSGMTVAARLANPPGGRVESIEIAGRPLDPARIYTLATNDYLARGADGYSMLAGKATLTGDSGSALVANDVMVHARKLGTLAAKLERRLRLR